MQMQLFDWLDREFVALSCEGDPGLAGDESTLR